MMSFWKRWPSWDNGAAKFRQGGRVAPAWKLLAARKSVLSLPKHSLSNESDSAAFCGLTGCENLLGCSLDPRHFEWPWSAVADS